jgi:hypothetical protein
MPRPANGAIQALRRWRLNTSEKTKWFNTATPQQMKPVQKVWLG